MAKATAGQVQQAATANRDRLRAPHHPCLYGRRMRSASACASAIAWAGVLLPFRQLTLSVQCLVERWFSCTDNSARGDRQEVRATLAAGTLAMKSFIVGLSYAAGLVAI